MAKHSQKRIMKIKLPILLSILLVIIIIFLGSMLFGAAFNNISDDTIADLPISGALDITKNGVLLSNTLLNTMLVAGVACAIIAAVWLTLNRKSSKRR